MARIRLRGLVRAMNEVRQQLAAGIPRSEMDAFRHHVSEIVAQVEKICREHNTSPDRLPGPSLRAYRFLKNLDLDDIPVGEATISRLGRELRVKNLVSACEALHAEMDDHARGEVDRAGGASQQVERNLTLRIRSHAERVEKLAGEAGVSPAAMPVRSRRAYQWLKFLGDPANLALHLATLKSAHQILHTLRSGKPRSPVRGRSFLVALYHTGYLYRARQGASHTRILLNEGFLGAPRAAIAGLMRLALGWGTEGAEARVRRYADGEDFAEIVQTLELTGMETDLSTRGLHYDLEEVFDRVNARYFDGRLARPLLTWNRALTRRKFGHYQPSSDLIMISISLDDPRVPVAVIDFVMYHELLHKELGVQIIGGRRYVHTKAFREREKAFHAFEEAKGYLDGLAGG